MKNIMTYKEFEKIELSKATQTFDNLNMSTILRAYGENIYSKLYDIDIFKNNSVHNNITVTSIYNSKGYCYEINDCKVYINNSIIDKPELTVSIKSIDINNNIPKAHRYNNKNFKIKYKIVYKEDCFICVYETDTISDLYTYNCTCVGEEVYYNVYDFKGHYDTHVNKYCNDIIDTVRVLFTERKNSNTYGIPSIMLHAINVLRSIIFIGMSSDKKLLYTDVMDKSSVIDKIKTLYIIYLISVNNIIIEDEYITFIGVKRSKLTYYTNKDSKVIRNNRTLTYHNQYIDYYKYDKTELFNIFYHGFKKFNCDIKSYYDEFLNNINYMIINKNKWDCKKRISLISLLCKDEIENIYQ